MNTSTITRAFLKELPETRKRGAADQVIRQHVDAIQASAAQGKSSYMFEPDNVRHYQRHGEHLVLTSEDFVAAFQRKFPDCSVTCKEEWIDIDPTKRVLKRGIVIDWS